MTAGKTTWQIPKRVFPLQTVTKQEPKNNTDCRQKLHALCFCEQQRCHDSVFFCQRSVTASAKGPGPPRYKGQNQWSFGKTDGKPLADRWETRERGDSAGYQHIIAAVSSRSREETRGSCRHARPVLSFLSDELKKPLELQQLGRFHFQGQNAQHPNPSRTHMNIPANEWPPKQKRGGTQSYGQLIQTVKWNCFSSGSKGNIHSQAQKFAF